MVQKINLRERSSSVAELFEYLKVGQLNDHMLNVVNVESRTLDFHVHADSDELFYVVEGRMQVELRDELIDLAEGDLVIIPKGTEHRPVCTTLVRCLLIEKIGTLTRDNTGGTYSD